MTYVISFLEGIITFISPVYFPCCRCIVVLCRWGRAKCEKNAENASGFIAGFTLVFVSLGALAGTVGHFLQTYSTIVNIVTGLIVAIFGLHFLGVFQLSFFRGVQRAGRRKELGFFSSMLFGMVFSVGWTPCVGAFLGSALLLASQQGHVLTGVLMLLAYSLGLGIPFAISAVLVEKLKGAFQAIKTTIKSSTWCAAGYCC